MQVLQFSHTMEFSFKYQKLRLSGQAKPNYQIIMVLSNNTQFPEDFHPCRTSQTRGGSRIFERGGSRLGLQAKKGGADGGPILGPMLKSLHRGTKGGVQTPWTPPPGSAHVDSEAENSMIDLCDDKFIRMKMWKDSNIIYSQHVICCGPH